MKKNYDDTEEVEKLKNLKQYHLVKVEWIPELNANLCILEHRKTKARVIVIPCKDENKVFNIGFRTPSDNSTGVAHIIEHSVLCGSKKFPAKDPFIELVKGSLNTFLNAMTYPDRTMYPVASVNDKDFRNLMEVYLDAVFYPNIYREKNFFLQEGWRYHLENKEDDLEYTGVVYNEMKGVYSGIDGMLDYAIDSTLYGDSIYAKDSGGNPEYIPDLSYEEFLQFHKTYYHPSNSFIFLYGDMDMEERLQWMDAAYLSQFEYMMVDSKVADVAKIEGSKTFTFDYPISDTEDEENATCLAFNVLVGDVFDPVRMKALDILAYVLLDKPGARLKEALLDAGIGEDVESQFSTEIKEPAFSIIAKNVPNGKMAEFMTVLKGTIRKICNEGLDKEELFATINVNEFRAREADFGTYPRGLIYLLNMMKTWVYDKDPTLYLRYENTTTQLRDLVSQGYFEKLLQEVFLDNTYEVFLTLNPVKGLSFMQDEKLKEKLKKIKAQMREEELDALILQTKNLQIFQETPSTQEERESIPILHIEDIDRERNVPEYTWRSLTLQGIEVKQMFLEEFTYGINYVHLLFDVSWISQEDIPYLSFFASLLKRLDTKAYPYQKISTLSNLHLGGLSFGIESAQNTKEDDDFRMYFRIAMKSLERETKFGLDLAKEILQNTLFVDKKRIWEIVAEQRAVARSQMVGSGHSIALSRAGSAFVKSGYFQDATTGIRYLRFIEDLYEHFDERVDAVLVKMQEIQKRVPNLCKMLVCVESTNEGFAIVQKNLPAFCEGMRMAEEKEEMLSWELSQENAAFCASSQVNYVAMAATTKPHTFSGVWRIVANLMNFDYLWMNVRIKGGAYGCSATFTRSGVFGMSSYRDPNITNTYQVYERIAEYVKNIELDERELRKSIIGVISQMDIPQTPSMKLGLALGLYLQNITKEDLQKEREEVLDATKEQIRMVHTVVEDAIKNAVKVTVGNEVMLKEESDTFDTIQNLFGE